MILRNQKCSPLAGTSNPSRNQRETLASDSTNLVWEGQGLPWRGWQCLISSRFPDGGSHIRS